MAEPFSPEPLRIVGTGVPRIDGVQKLTGQALYGVDVHFPGMLAGKVLRSPLAHARIQNISTERARRVPGVRAVMTGADTPGIKYGFFKHQNPRYADKLPLETEKVRFIGDEVAAVAAVDEEAALEALALIEVDYEDLPAVFSPEEALKSGAPLVHEKASGNVAAIVRRGAGDIEQGWRQAEVVLERHYSTQAVAPCCLEPHQAVANFDPASGVVTLWSSTQMPFQLRRELADVLGIPEAKVHIIKTVMGAGFGSRMEMHAPDPIAALLSLKTHRPVRIVYSRTEEFQATRFRHPMSFDCRLGLTRSGRITALEVKTLVDSGAYLSQAPGEATVAGTNPFSIYKVPAFRFEGTAVYTNKPYGGAYRGYGNPQGTFAIEGLLDEAALELGIDRFELRRRNLHNAGDETVLGYRLESCAQRECLEAVVRALKPHQKRGRGRGIGIAGLFNPGGGTRVHGNSDGCGAMLKIEDDGTLQILIGGQEIGQGGATAIAQIAAEALGLTYEAVRVESSDTNLIPWDLGTHGSRNTFVSGNAVIGAAKKLRSRIIEVAAELLNAENPDYLEVGAGRVWIQREPDRSVSIAEVAKAAHYRRDGSVLMAEHFYDPPTEEPDSTGHGNKSAAYSFGFHGAEVDVDQETGEVRVLRMVAAHDVGRVINPLGAQGQVEGGIAQGIGFALVENMFADGGQTLLSNMQDYKIPAAADLPAEIEILLIESRDPHGPFGAKGIAEPGVIPVAPAIANAVADATGVRIRDLPITPEKIHAALRAVKDK
ncbi:MAG: xanthine dehydrogenase family protein molybdopterin-binding subunit [Deltaproteobacteria bacterium]|nr:xanthine dehydrogenase family protein molybdopterin-binding subunit [Deltaproteobacteria bacterium]